MSWRVNVLSCLYPNQYHHIYEFGVLTGNSIIELLNMFDHIVDRIFGFDSFCGLPAVPNTEVKQETWCAGAMSATTVLNCGNTQEVIKLLDKKINSNKVRLIDGFYKDSLQDTLVEQLKMQPAFYVDIDCDLYSSTYDALDFMARNHLIRPGTYIGYDDWGGTIGWEKCESGESLAHTQIAAKYGLRFVSIAQYGSGYPHVQRVFQCVT